MRMAWAGGRRDRRTQRLSVDVIVVVLVGVVVLSVSDLSDSDATTLSSQVRLKRSFQLCTRLYEVSKVEVYIM